MKVVLELDLNQAHALKAALDVYSRLGLGQFEQIPELVRDGTIISTDCDPVTRRNDRELVDRMTSLANAMKEEMGHPVNGNYGIGNRQVHESAHRTWEIYKALSQALAMNRDPNPRMRGVDYDGVMVRYTNDPMPKASIKKDPAPSHDEPSP